MDNVDKNVIILNNRISDVLLLMGCDASLNGFDYVKSAVVYLLSKEGPISMMYDLYPTIADMKETVPTRVERNIRHMIEMAWRRGRAAEINKFFGFKLYHPYDKPTNKEFLLLLADRLSQEFIVSSEGKVICIKDLYDK